MFLSLNMNPVTVSPLNTSIIFVKKKLNLQMINSSHLETAPMPLSFFRISGGAPEWLQHVALIFFNYLEPLWNHLHNSLIQQHP